MSADDRLARLRWGLLILAVGFFAGTVLELVAVGHTDSLVQFIPFVLCLLGVIAAALVAISPAPIPMNAIRGFLVVMLAGSLFGIWEHLEGNYEFAHEIRPRADTAELLREALTGGNPLMAPGMLAFGAALVIAASYATVRAPRAATVASGGTSRSQAARPAD